MIRNIPRPATVFGIDIGKNVFHVVGLDASGHPIQKSSFRRDTLLQFFERAAPTLVGMEACPGSQWLARKIAAMSHQVRILPAQFVKPYVKSNKSDIIDAAASADPCVRLFRRTLFRADSGRDNRGPPGAAMDLVTLFVACGRGFVGGPAGPGCDTNSASLLAADMAASR